MKTKRILGDYCSSKDQKKRGRVMRKSTAPALVKQKVLKMLAVMENQQAGGSSGNSGTTAISPENGAHAKEFLSSGRTGRRNALPNILGEHAVVSSSDLPGRLQALTTSEKMDETAKEAPGPSSKS